MKITIPYKANIVLKKNNSVEEGFSCHAEEAVLNKFYNNKYLIRSKLHIIVIRVNSSGNIIYSKPCPNCCKKMQAYGVKKVTYSDEEGNLVTCKLNNLGECKVSSGHRNWNLFKRLK